LQPSPPRGTGTRGGVKKDEFPMAHEFLFAMPGIPGSEVTSQPGNSGHSGLVRFGRSRLKILDQKGIGAVAYECYLIRYNEL
jgi:hypothetical protein